MELIGKVKVVNPMMDVSATFKKREIVITTDEQYPQTIMVEFTQDKCALLDQFQIGQDVKISINIRGREWVNPQGEVKYFNSIQGWRIEHLAAAPQQGYGAPQGYAAPPQGYAAPQQGYAAPQQGYAAPQQAFGAPQQGFAPQGTQPPFPAANAINTEESDDLPF